MKYQQIKEIGLMNSIPKIGQPSLCHPEKPSRTRGLCNSCYQKEMYRKNPEKYKQYVKNDLKKNKEKRAERRRQHYRENIEVMRKRDKQNYHKNIEHNRQVRRDWGLKNREREMVTDAKKRAKQCNLEFSITHEDIVIPEMCPYLGIPLIKGKSIRCENSPTLDRINPKKGYTKNNIIVVSHRANRIKNDSTPEELELIAKAVRNLLGRDAQCLQD